MSDAQVLQKLRKICLAFPETTETASWGHPNFRTPKRMFAAFDEYGGEKFVAFIAPPPVLEDLEGKPHFRRAGHRGWMLRDLEEIDWKELKMLLAQAHASAVGPAKKKVAAKKKKAAKKKAAKRKVARARRA